MPREVKVTTTTQARPSSFISLLSGWMQQGVESLFATQKILVDLAMRQNANAMKTLRDGLSDPEHSPASILTEIAVEGTANFIEAQRILLTLVQEENELVANGVKERIGSYPVAVNMTDAWRRSIDTFVEMQQSYLTIVNKQTQSWLQANKAGKGFDGTHLVEFAREAMDNFVHAQKKFLDVIAEETTKATSSGPRPAHKMTKTDVPKLAREATNSFIDAQKKLLDLAGQQMNVNLNAATRTMDMMTPFRLMPLSNFTGEGVKSFVDAEKALIDSMMKPKEKKERVVTETKVKRTTIRRRRTAKPRAAHATA
jgi:hypothetical protein